VTPVVKPGEKGQILVKFNTLSFLGDRHSRITVSVTSPQFTELYLDIEGRVRRDIVVDPGQISWGTVRPGETAERSVDIRYAGVGTWQITKVDCNDPNVELTLAETKREGIRIDYRLTAKLKPEHPTGQFAGQVILYTTDSQQSTFPIGLNGYVKALIETDPVVDVGQIQQGKPVVRRIVLKSDNAFVVTETQSSGSQIKLKTSNEKKRMHVIEIEVVPDTEGRLENDIFVKTDLQNEPTPIRVIGEVLPSIQTNSGNAKAEDR
jgi:hypothetical protein